MQKEENIYIQTIKQKISSINSQIESIKQQAVFLEGSKRTLEQLLEEFSKED
jgi:prefoldin subunit 5